MAPSIGSTSLQILLTLAYCPFLLLAFIPANRRGRFFIAAFFIVISQLLPPSVVVENDGSALNSIYQVLLPDRRPYKPLPGWADLLALPVFLLPSIVLSTGVIVTTVLFASGMQLYLERGRNRAAGLYDLPALRNQDDRFAGASLVLSGLVLVATLYNLYWLLVLDSTTDSVGIIWLVFTAPVVVLSAGLLFLHLLRRATLAGFLYALLIPGSFIVVSVLAWRVDYRALTEARAERVSQAIEAYHAREGRYPDSLRQLTPRYILSLPGPVIINGQDWCFEGDEAGYQFGYVDRDHWSSPHLDARLYWTRGATENLPDLCATEIAKIRKVRGW